MGKYHLKPCDLDYVQLLGYKIEFEDMPIQYKISVPINFNKKTDLLDKNAISESRFESNQFICKYFYCRKETKANLDQ